jgi:hypothetical protein
MKIILTMKPESAPKTYIILSPVVQDNTETEKKINILSHSLLNSLDDYIEDGEAEEIILDDIIEYIRSDIFIMVFEKCIKKIKHGGKIIITGTDIYLVCKAFVEYKISIEELNLLVYGNAKNIGLTSETISKYLEKIGFKIIKRRHEIYDYLIEAQRP